MMSYSNQLIVRIFINSYILMYIFIKLTNAVDLQTIMEIRTEYNTLDLQHDQLNTESFIMIIYQIFPEWKKKDDIFVSRLFRALDTNGNHHLHFKELVSGLSILCRGSLEERMDLCTQVFNRTGEGITKEDMQSLLCSIYRLFDQEDCIHEVKFFVDMLFNMGSSARQENEEGTVLDDKQFKSVLVMQPMIVKCFLLDQPKTHISPIFHNTQKNNNNKSLRNSSSGMKNSASSNVLNTVIDKLAVLR
jgi:Ca2+-binding EF-hand superfamily protein